MCELCGCGVVGAKARLANASRVPPVLAAIRVKVVERARGAIPADPRQTGVLDRRLARHRQRALRE